MDGWMDIVKTRGCDNCSQSSNGVIILTIK